MRYRNDISAEALRKMIDFNPDTGVFKWREREDVPPKINGRRSGKIAGCFDKKTGHILIGINGRLYLAHRLAWLHFYGEWPANHVDHINCDRSDNSIRNLRDATHSQNLWNRGASRISSTGFKGVTANKRSGGFFARITANGKTRHLGTFETAVDAHKAYASAASSIHGEFARVS
jgi:hypothetical protein